MIITTCIIAVLASVAIREMRGYSRRATLSEVVLAGTQCKNAVSEGFLTFDSQPAPGAWGCETASSGTVHAGRVQTSDNGAIRIAIRNVDANVDGKYVYLVPARTDGATQMKTPADLGNGVRAWICGSDLSFVRASLPANCRSDTSVISAAETFGP
jgi:type IV pilus assembly protein PilA